MIGKDAWLNLSGMEDGNSEPAIVIEDKALVGPRVQISAKNFIYIKRGASGSPFSTPTMNGNATSWNGSSRPWRDLALNAPGVIPTCD
jgi:hypothetical protein